MMAVFACQRRTKMYCSYYSVRVLMCHFGDLILRIRLFLYVEKHGISESGGNISRAVKVEVVAKARELPCYFCCLFMASVRA